jgi:hypothetical protein
MLTEHTRVMRKALRMMLVDIEGSENLYSHTSVHPKALIKGSLGR